MSDLRPLRATARDVPRVVETITAAFDADPTWTWVLDDAVIRRAAFPTLWQVIVEGGLRYDAVWMLDDAATVSVWLPPGGSELSDEQLPLLDAWFDGLPADVATRARTLWSAFDAHRPVDRPHHYLNVLATDPAQRGRGLGMSLLTADLVRIDALGEPAYLESTNPVNNARYASVGFHVHGAFDLAVGGPTVTTMWREARAVTSARWLRSPRAPSAPARRRAIVHSVDAGRSNPWDPPRRTNPVQSGRQTSRGNHGPAGDRG